MLLVEHRGTVSHDNLTQMYQHQSALIRLCPTDSRSGLTLGNDSHISQAKWWGVRSWRKGGLLQINWPRHTSINEWVSPFSLKAWESFQPRALSRIWLSGHLSLRSQQVNTAPLHAKATFSIQASWSPSAKPFITAHNKTHHLQIVEAMALPCSWRIAYEHSCRTRYSWRSSRIYTMYEFSLRNIA